eukprot:g15519.t1
MFESFRELTSTVISKAKATRSLKLLSTLNTEEIASPRASTSGRFISRSLHRWGLRHSGGNPHGGDWFGRDLNAVDQRQIDEYKAWMADAVRAMEAMRLMVEGHFFPMQQHLHSQSGSSRSCDVLEQTCRLVVQMAKDPKGGDSMMPEEIQCISQALTLLIELCQGPNLQNQARLLQPNFELICQLEGDVYPPTVRRLKALLMDGMLALVEGRLDSQIHVTIPQRLDPLALKECGTRQATSGGDSPDASERIEFVHSYFVFGIVGVARRTVQSDQVARIPLEANTRHLLSSSGASPSDVYQSLLAASVLAEELLEDLSDADIRNFFSEGLKILVAQYSSTFESIVKPTKDEDETFVDDTSQYLSEKHYLQA